MTIDRNAALASLTPREREVLSLLATGHDAKSIARALGISVHTVNDRLRDARRKLGTGTSREAARQLAGMAGAPDRSGPEDPGPKDLGPEDLGLVGGAPMPPAPPRPAPRGAAAWRLPIVIGGVTLMIFLTVTTMAFWSPTTPSPSSAGNVPQVVSTMPAEGAVIPPGPFDLIVRYDRPMQDGSMSYVQATADSFPECPGVPQLSADGRTWVHHCRAMAGRSYEIWFNRAPYMNFRSVTGVAAQPHRLRFVVRDAR